MLYIMSTNPFEYQLLLKLFFILVFFSFCIYFFIIYSIKVSIVTNKSKYNIYTLFITVQFQPLW